MMRNQLPQARTQSDSHPGLLLQRYVAHSADGSERWSQAKGDIHTAAISAIPCELYTAAFDRWRAMLPKDPPPIELATEGRLIVGLGSENVLETGIRLHHTYGVPIIPGSALKGLAAHYCDQVWGERNNPIPSDEALKFRGPRKEDRKNNRPAEPQGSYHSLLFGATDDSGCIVFHDAWFVPDSDKAPLNFDVMTPHHSGWNNVDNPEPPTDFDSPIPVPFLSVVGKFLVAVAWQGPISDKAKNWTELALSLLRDALFEWGVGGKTSSGYGRFDEELWKNEEANRQQEAEKRRKEEAAAAAFAAMNPTERKIKDLLENHPNKNETRSWLKLFEELRKLDGRFTEQSERQEVALVVKQGMQKDKVWKDKGKDGERKKFIEGILGDNS